jgi:dTDP-4-dehydrorhamnose reductase
MRVLLIGAQGQLGHELRVPLACFTELVSPSRAELDLGAPGVLRAAVTTARPDVVVNAAAYNDVDRAEREPELAERINGDAVAELGALAKSQRFALITYSTDFVFDGKKPSPYVETDATEPLGAYARSKRAGERALLDLQAPALIVRTAWVYSLRRKSFVSSILRLAREKDELRVVDDQVGSPTFCRDLAQATALLVRGLGDDPVGFVEQARGVYHVAGGGACSRYELARAAIELDPRRAEHRLRRLLPCSTLEYPLPAPRPARAVLDSGLFGRRFGIRLPGWQDGLERALLDRV